MPLRTHETVHSSIGYRRQVVVPAASELGRAAEILNSGERGTMLVGAGALGAADEVEQVAERLGAPGSRRRCSAKPCCPTT